MAEPIEETIDEFFALGAELHRLDRFHRSTGARISPGRSGSSTRWPRHACSCRPAAVPFRAHRGIYVMVEELLDADGRGSGERGRVARRAGRRGCVDVRRARPVSTSKRWTPGARRITVCWLDDDVLEAAHAHRARRRRAAGALRATGRRVDVRRTVRDDHPVEMGLVRSLGARRNSGMIAHMNINASSPGNAS